MTGALQVPGQDKMHQIGATEQSNEMAAARRLRRALIQNAGRWLDRRMHGVSQQIYND
ncbi:hypothetical protein ACFIQF_12745 [Comamonas sp. J-3]|uniref:hypothetical protein n=1 Tax=Comamonas trifloxystrobinivorans TaxID=3350256 RepID=UPI00372BC232